MIYLFIIVLVFGLDFAIKQYFEIYFPKNKVRELFGGKLIFRKAYNKGAALNFLAKKQEFVAGFSAALVIVTLLAEIALISKKGAHVLKIGLALIVGGGLSNVYDRLVRNYVVDYISFGVKWKKLKNIVFNLSDLCIFIGALFVVFARIFQKEK